MKPLPHWPVRIPRAKALAPPVKTFQVKTIARAGIDVLFPPACAACQTEIENVKGGVLLCTDCRQEFLASSAACRRCGAGVPISGAPLDDCSQCRGRRLRFEATVRLGSYDGELRRAILRMKQSGQQPLSIAIGKLLAAERAGQLGQLDVDAVLPIPMHWSRRLWRGVNSPELLAEQLACALRVPVAAFLLKRRRRTAPQAALSPPQRLRNVRGAFHAAQHKDLEGARILLVDDVMTTGATANEAARMLRERGAAFVAVAVLARAEA